MPPPLCKYATDEIINSMFLPLMKKALALDISVSVPSLVLSAPGVENLTIHYRGGGV